MHFVKISTIEESRRHETLHETVLRDILNNGIEFYLEIQEKKEWTFPKGTLTDTIFLYTHIFFQSDGVPDSSEISSHTVEAIVFFTSEQKRCRVKMKIFKPEYMHIPTLMLSWS